MNHASHVLFRIAVLAGFCFFMSCNNQSQHLLVLGIANEGGGSGTINAAASTTNGMYASATEITAQAEADSGCMCAGWYDAERGGVLVSEENPYTFPISEDTLLYARFEIYVGPDSEDPTVTISNIRNNGLIESGIITGTASDDSSVTSVQVKLDGGSYHSAEGTNSWKFKLPAGNTAWRKGTVHTVSVRCRDAAGHYSDESAVILRVGTNKDINGDGYADAAVGAEGYNLGQGRVYIFEGSAAGIPDSDLSGADSASATLTGEGGAFGSDVALGDVNGDGYADVVAGAPGHNGAIGRVYIFYGGPTGIGDQSAGSAVTTLSGEVGIGFFGSSLAVGDVTGDGYCDIAVGAKFAFSIYGGAVYIFEGNAAGIPDIDLGGGGSADTKIISEGDWNYLGEAVSIGDVNGDGYDELVVSAPGYGGSLGRIYIFQGSSGGIASRDLSGAGLADTTLTGPGIAAAEFGKGLAAGDVNGDGYADVAVGAHSDPGRVYIFEGSGSGISDLDLSSGGTSDALLIGESANDEFGSAVACGDVTGDGFSDLAVGAYGHSGQTGQVFVFHGGPGGITDQVLSIDGESDTELSGEAATTSFGSSLGLCDLTGDGYHDLVVGADTYNSQQGRAYIFEGASSGIPDQHLSGLGTADSTLTGETTGDEFGISISR